MLKKIFFLLLIFTCNNLFSKNIVKEQEYIDSLSNLGKIIINGKNDFVRFEANEKFKNLLIFLLSHDKSINLNFSAVDNLSQQKTSDKSFQILTWVVPKTDESFVCYGIVHLHNKRSKKYEIHELTDVRNKLENIEYQTLCNGDWFGALYYEMLRVRSFGKTYYTLLGWNGNDALSTLKIIDVISIRNNSEVVFGDDLFVGYGKNQRRIVFEYSSKTQMTLRREKIKKGRRSAKMIVFDRLEPMAPGLEGLYQFYVPSTNIVDAFIFKNDKWQFIKDIDARNPKSPKDKKEPKPSKVESKFKK